MLKNEHMAKLGGATSHVQNICYTYQGTLKFGTIIQIKSILKFGQKWYLCPLTFLHEYRLVPQFNADI